ncbi:MAG: NAD-binding protein [Candidatus Kariarchaeaceae archaeon]|jgi:Trk K+ transport system NAD-binding subunit
MKKSGEIPLRVRILLIIVSIVFTLSILAFRYLEDLSWLDSIYFLVVTVSTVGFGDVAPDHALTKIVLIMLIITGITTIALLSEFAIDKIIKLRLSQDYDLITLTDDYQDHIVIGGYSPVGENIASLARDRFLSVIIIDSEEYRIKSAREDGFEAYRAYIERPSILQKLRLEHALGFYLFLEDDAKTIQASILARKLADNLPIYADTKSPISVEFGNLLGITRTYHRERLISSFIMITFKQFKFIRLPNQDTPDSAVQLVLLDQAYLTKLKIPEYYILGSISQDFTSMQIPGGSKKLIDDNIVFIAVPRSELNKNVDFSTVEVEAKYSKIIVGGFSAYVQHVLRHLDIAIENFLVITFDKKEKEYADEYGVECIWTNKQDLPDIIDAHLNDTDLVVNMFENMIESLMMNTLIENSQKNPGILQIVQHSHEIDIYLQSGADRIITPDALMSRGMFQILLSEKQYPTSLIYDNGHVFEYRVKKNDFVDGKSASNLKKEGYDVLLQKRPVDNVFIENPSLEVNAGDHLVLHTSHSLYSTHHQDW